MADAAAKPVIFISYARKDEPAKPTRGEVQWRTYVQSYLAPAVTNGIVHVWADAGIRGGDKWKDEIEAQLKTCDLFILLVSVSSLASEVVVDFEIKTVLDRRSRGEGVHVFPIVLKPFPKKAVPWLMELNLRPNAGKPLSDFSSKLRDREMAAIADEVIEILAQVRAAGAAVHVIGSAEQPKVAQGVLETDTGPVVIDVSHLPETPYERLVGRDDQLKRLDDAWAGDKTNIISLIAEGGAGKSALVNEWLKRLQSDGYRGAETVLGWSFYSQGSKERATSAEEFLNWALGKLGITLATTSASAKGEAIAEAMETRCVLLVLDGVEPLQHGLDRQHGELKDQGLRALLRRFAAMPPATARGLVLTSRLPIRDIALWKESTAPVIDVEELSATAGAALLRDNGVWGTDKELAAASNDFGGHPLALGLLASFLTETQNGDVRRRDHIGERPLTADPENPRHDHARRVMESYEKEWLVNEPAAQAIMFMLGLFDRPASADCLDALRAAPVIDGLTDAIIGLDDSAWQRAVARLREVRLLSPHDPAAPRALDAHPLVREWFGERLRLTNEAAWKAAHGRLYEYLRDTTKEGDEPDLTDLAPLYQAIGHGCRAGRYQEALNDVYVSRICRRGPDGRIEFYATHKLGAIGSALAALSWFFTEPYEKPVMRLAPTDQARVLGEASHFLRVQGRLSEALPGQRLALQISEDAHDWGRAATIASNLSGAELRVGEVAAAGATAEKAVEYADRGGDEFQMLAYRVRCADSLHAAGRREEAERALADVEGRQKGLLVGLQGYQYSDLLLGKGDYASAHYRATEAIATAKSNSFLRDIALDTLTLGRARFGLACATVGSGQVVSVAREDTYTARTCLDETIDGLRVAGNLDDVPRALLARAAFRRSVGDWEGASRDLDEVEEIAEPGPMKLDLCDMALERARLALARIEAFAPLNGLVDDSPPKPESPSEAERQTLHEEAAKQLKIAADYIATCGYHRRDEELAELQSVLKGERTFASLSPRV